MGEAPRERHREQGAEPDHEQRQAEVADADSDVGGDPRNARGEAPGHAAVHREHDRRPASRTANDGSG